MSVLTDIQNELKVPKNKYNAFGEYKYRSCEDILEAVKPLLKKYDATMVIQDEIVEAGGRVYVKATAKLAAHGESTPRIYETTAFAREAEEKKKMDVSQVTGMASSYARKYALNGLFLIDDASDPDTEEKPEENIADQEIGKTKAEALEKYLVEQGQNIENIKAYCGVQDLAKLTEKQHYTIMENLRKRGNNGKTKERND